MDDISAKLDAIEKMLNDELAERQAGITRVPLVNMNDDDDDDDDAALGLSRRRLLEEIVAEIEASEAVRTGPVVSGGAAENDPFEAAMSANDAKGSLGGNDPDPYLTQGPSTIWNGMIYPIRKFRFAGVAWYQGESNFADPVKYSCLFPATITGWRAGFENPAMSWAFVQLHAYNLHDWSEFRNAQALATRKLPGVVMASAIDLGDPTSPFDPIHPRYKQEVGRRLAQAAIASRYSDYGGVHYSGPRFRDVQPVAVAPEDNAGVKGLVLKFEDGNGGAAPGTTHASDAAACSLTGSKKCCGESPFAVVDADTGEIKRVPFWVDNAGDNGAGKVVLSIDSNVKKVKEVRYAWERFPQCLLYNGVGGYEAYTDAMPAAPWCFDVVTGAPCPVRNLPNPWAAGVRTTADMGFTTMLHKLPVRDLIQWGQKDFAEEYRPASAGGGADAGDGAEAGARVSADVGDAPASDDFDTSDAPASDAFDTSDVGSAEQLDDDTSDAPASDVVDASDAPALDVVDASDDSHSYEDEIIMDTSGTPAYSLFTPEASV
uniref:Sialate O-acetylesterase domain-containing protein n=1 Tax=Micromonas pusilla TaxID=38833 RepID=A0A7S0KGB9_MICPS